MFRIIVNVLTWRSMTGWIIIRFLEFEGRCVHSREAVVRVCTRFWTDNPFEYRGQRPVFTAVQWLWDCWSLRQYSTVWNFALNLSFWIRDEVGDFLAGRQGFYVFFCVLIVSTTTCSATATSPMYVLDACRPTVVRHCHHDHDSSVPWMGRL